MERPASLCKYRGAILRTENSFEKVLEQQQLWPLAVGKGPKKFGSEQGEDKKKIGPEQQLGQSENFRLVFEFFVHIPEPGIEPRRVTDSLPFRSVH